MQTTISLIPVDPLIVDDHKFPLLLKYLDFLSTLCFLLEHGELNLYNSKCIIKSNIASTMVTSRYLPA